MKCAGYLGLDYEAAPFGSNVPVDVEDVLGATQISTGSRHTCALVAGGAVKCWGSNWVGELGSGYDFINSNSGVYVSAG